MSNWILQVRTNAGKLKNTFRYDGITQEGMDSVKTNMEIVFPPTKYSMEVHPATKIVKNLMSGKEIEIDYDTPLCCDPSSETYWSM